MPGLLKNKRILAATMAISMAASYCPTTLAQAKKAPSETEICNFSKVTNELYRGAYPAREVCFQKLKRLGINSIINLRMPGTPELKERSLAKKYQFKYFHEPFGYLKPTDKQIEKVLAIITEPSNQPVFIHCMQGADRTGMIIGVYRRRMQSWKFNETYKEMRSHHFKPWFLGLRSKVLEASPDNRILVNKPLSARNTKTRAQKSLASKSSQLSM